MAHPYAPGFRSGGGGGACFNTYMGRPLASSNIRARYCPINPMKSSWDPPRIKDTAMSDAQPTTRLSVNSALNRIQARYMKPAKVMNIPMRVATSRGVEEKEKTASAAMVIILRKVYLLQPQIESLR